MTTASKTLTSVENNLPIEERLKAIREKWFLVDPAYFMTLCTHKLELNANMKCPIACGGGYIYVHPTLLNNVSDKFLEEALKTEIIRILLKHPYGRQLPNAVKMYIASDMTIGNNTNFSEYMLTTSKEVFKTEEYNKESMEALYSLIKLPELQGKGKGFSIQIKSQGNSNNQNNNKNSNSDSNSQNESGSGSENNNSNNNSNTNNSNSKKNSKNKNNKSDNSEPKDNNNDPLENFDSGCSSMDDAVERTQFWKEDEFYYETVNNLIGKIENSGNKSWGSMPGSVVDEIKKALIPKFDYKSVFRRVRSTIPSSKRSLTRMRPNRRFGYDAMGSKRECTTKILVAIDTSGSISDKELELALGFILGFFKTNIDSIWQIHWDTQVYPESFKELTKKTVKAKGKRAWGRGGTDVSAVYSALQSKGKEGFLRKEKFNLVIVLTDGYFSVPEKKWLTNNYNHTKYLFCLNNKQNYEYFKKNMKDMAKFGPCTFIDEQL